MSNLKFQAGIAVPPGDTLKEILDDRNITQKELALRLGVTAKHVNKIINGTASISPEIALKLESVLGITARFWNNLEMKYQETKARLKEIPQVEAEVSILNKLPYDEAALFGWFPQTTDSREKVAHLRTFFRLASLENLELVQDVCFRKSEVFKANDYAVSLWLNQAENQALEIETEYYSSSKLKEMLLGLKKLTNRPLKASGTNLVELCASVGIALVFIPNLTGTHVNGATKWLENKKVMVAMSTKGVYEDIFWFSFFHEIGHVLQENKLVTFIDVEDTVGLNDLEKDADKFSSDFLIPKEQYKEFISDLGYKDVAKIRQFAEKIGVHIGILIGRLLHDKFILYNSPEYKSLERLRRKYKI